MLKAPDPTARAPAFGEEQGGNRILAFLAAIAMVTALYVGREVLVPIALAVLLAFVLSPVILVLRKAKVPRTASVVTVVLVTFLGLIALGGLVAMQVTQLAADLPRYQATMRDKIQSVREATGGSGPLERAMEMLQDLNRELDSPETPTELTTPAEGRPIPVEVRQPAPGTLGTLSSVIRPLIHPLATTGIIFIFVVFILLQREDLRNRFIRLAGAHDIQRTTAALDDAGERLARFFLTQVALNAAFGAVIGLGLWVIGLPSPLLWGLIAAVLRFVPYVGAIVGAFLPIALALAVDPGWTMVLSTAALFLLIEPLVGHVIEPWLYGRSTGLSPVAVITAATFWTWLWGPIGLVLSTPLTLCLVVLGRHVPQLEFLDVALGDRPPLSAPELLYQRMLAGDPVEAAAAAEDFLKEKHLIAYCDEVALPALRLAQHDAARGVLGAERQEVVRATLVELIDYLPEGEPDVVPEPRAEGVVAALAGARRKSEPTPPALAKADAALAPEAPSPAGTPGADAAGTDTLPQGRVLILAARSALDEAAGQLLAHVLELKGIRCETMGHLPLRRGSGPPPGLPEASLCVLSYLSQATPAHRRYTIRRLRRDDGGAKVLIADWAASERAPIPANGETRVVSTMEAALAACLAAEAEEDEGGEGRKETAPVLPAA